MGDIGTIYTKIGADVSDLKRADTAVKGFTSSFGSHMKTATAAIFSWQAAVASVIASISFGKVISDAKEYSTAIVDMGKVTDATASSIRKDIESIDAALGSSTQLMKGYYEVLSSGYKPGVQGLELLTTAAKSSKAAHIDQATTILALTKMMAGYSGQLKTATEASDLLFKIEEIGITKFQELVPIIGSVSNVSRIAGLSAKEMGGALALITQTAGSTSEAATELEAMLTALIKPTTEMTSLFAKFGGVSKAIAEIGLVEVLKKIEDATWGSTEALAELLGGRKEALIGFASLAVNNFGTVTEYIKKMDDAAGVSKKNWEAFESSFEGIADKFWNTLSNTLAKAGLEVLPTIGKAFEHMGQWLKENEQAIIDVFKAGAVAVEAFANNLWIAVEAGKAFIALQMASVIAAIIPKVVALGVAFTATSIAMKATVGEWGLMATGIVTVINLFDKLKMFAFSIFGKAGLVGLILYGVYEGMSWAMENNETFRNSVFKLIGFFQEAGEGLRYAWATAGTALKKEFFQVLNSIYYGAADVVNKIIALLNLIPKVKIDPIVPSKSPFEDYIEKAQKELDAFHAEHENRMDEIREGVAAATTKPLSDAVQSAAEHGSRMMAAFMYGATIIAESEGKALTAKIQKTIGPTDIQRMGKEQLAQYKAILFETEKLTKSAYAVRVADIEATYDKEVELAQSNTAFIDAANAHRKASYSALAKERVELEKHTQSVIASIQNIALQSQSKYLSMTLAGQVELKESAILEKKREIEATYDLAVDAARNDTLQIAAANAERRKAYAELVGDEIELEEMKRRRILEINTGLITEMMKDRQAWLDMIGGPAVDAHLAASLHKSEEYAKTTIDDIEKTWDNMIKNTQEKLGDVVYDAMEGNIESWGDLLDLMKDMFKRWLSEIIAYAAVRNIVIPILMGTKGLGGLVNIPSSAEELYGGGGGGVSGSILSTLVSKLGKELGLDKFAEDLGSQIWSGISSMFSNQATTNSAMVMESLGESYGSMATASASAAEGLAAVGTSATNSAVVMEALGEAYGSAAAVGATTTAAGAGTGFVATAAVAAPYVAALMAVPIVLKLLGTQFHKLISDARDVTASLSVSSGSMGITPGAATPSVSGSAWVDDYQLGLPFAAGSQSDIDEAIKSIIVGAQKHVTNLVRALPPALSDLLVDELAKVSISTGFYSHIEGNVSWQAVVRQYAEYISGQVNTAVTVAMKSAMDKFITPTWDELSSAFSKLAVAGEGDFGMDAFISKAEVLAKIGEKIDAFDYVGALTYYQDVLVFTSQLVSAGDELGFVTGEFVKSVHDLAAAGDFTKAAEQVRLVRDFVDTLLVAVQPTKQFDIALRTLAEEFGVIIAKAKELGISLVLVAKAQEEQTEAILKQKDAYIKSLVGLNEKGFISGSIGDALEAVGNLFKDWKDWFKDVNDAAESLMAAKSQLYYSMGGAKEKIKVGGETFNISDRMKAFTAEGEEVEPVLKKVMGKWIKVFRPVMDVIDHFALAGEAISKVVDKVYTSADSAKLVALNKWAVDYRTAADSIQAPSTVDGEFVSASDWFAAHPVIPLPELPYSEIEDWFAAYDAFGKKIEPLIDDAGKRTFKGLEGTIAYFELIDATVKTTEDIAPTKEDLDAVDAINKWLKAVREGTATLADLIALTPMKMEDFVGAVEEFVEAFNTASLGSGPAEFIMSLRQVNKAIEDITTTFDTLEYMAGDAATGVVNELEGMSKEALAAATKFRTAVIDDFFAPIQEIVDRNTLGDLGFAIKGLNDWYDTQFKVLKALEAENLLNPAEMKEKFSLLDEAYGISLDLLLDEYIGPINDALDEGAGTSGSAYVTALQEINDWYTTTGLAIAELYATLDPEKFEEFMDRLEKAYTSRVTKLAKDALADIGEDIATKTPTSGLKYTTGMRGIEEWFAATTAKIRDIMKNATDPAIFKTAEAMLKTVRDSYLTQVDVFKAEIKASFNEVMDPILDIINSGQLNEYSLAMMDLNKWYQKNLAAIFEYKDWLITVTGDTYDLATAIGILDQAMRVQVKSLIGSIMDPVYDIIAQGTLSEYEYEMKKLNIWYVTTVASITALVAALDPSFLADMGMSLEDFVASIKEAFDIQVDALNKSTQAVEVAARRFESISRSTIKNFSELGRALRSLSTAIRDSDPEIAAAARENAQALIEDYLTPFTKDVERFIDSLQTSELAPVQSAEMFKSKYEDLLSKALTGDTQALSDLQNFVQGEYLPFLQTFTAATGDYNTVFQGVLDDLNSISAAAIASVENLDVGRTMKALIDEVLRGMGIVAAPPPSITVYTTGVNLFNSSPAPSAYAQSGGYYSSRTNLVVGEKGGEWIVPTYEPERSSFLRDVGVNVDGIATSRSMEASAPEGAGGGYAGEGSTERQPIYLTVDGKVIAAVVVEQGRKNGQYIRSIRRLSKHGRKRAV